MYKNIVISAFTLCSMMMLTASHFVQNPGNLNYLASNSDSLKSQPPEVPGQDVGNSVPPVDATTVVTDSAAVYPKEINPGDIPPNTVQDTESREVDKHVPPGGEEQLEQLKSKELPVTNDSTVTRVKRSGEK